MKEFMSNKTYDVLKYIVQIGMPALTTFFVAIAQTWTIPYADQITVTMTALTGLLGGLLQISSIAYQKGKEKW